MAKGDQNQTQNQTQISPAIQQQIGWQKPSSIAPSFDMFNQINPYPQPVPFSGIHNNLSLNPFKQQQFSQMAQNPTRGVAPIINPNTGVNGGNTEEWRRQNGNLSDAAKQFNERMGFITFLT